MLIFFRCSASVAKISKALCARQVQLLKVFTAVVDREQFFFITLKNTIYTNKHNMNIKSDKKY